MWTQKFSSKITNLGEKTDFKLSDKNQKRIKGVDFLGIP